MAIEVKELQPGGRVPWYVKMLFSRRYALANRMLSEIREAVRQEIRELDLDSRDFPSQLEGERSLPALFQLLKATSYEEVRQELLRNFQTQLQTERSVRLETAQEIGREGEQLARAEASRHRINFRDLPDEISEKRHLASQAYRLLGESSANSAREKILQTVKDKVKSLRVGKLLARLEPELKENEAGIEISLKNIPLEFFLRELGIPSLKNVPGIESSLEKDICLLLLLNKFSADELDRLEENPGSGGYGKVILDILAKRKEAREIYHRPLNLGSGGRESTSKGSIGHDLFNVKTLRPSEWRGRAREVFTPAPHQEERRFSMAANY